MALPPIPPITAGPSAAYGAPSNASASVYVEGYQKAPDWQLIAIGAIVGAGAWYLLK